MKDKLISLILILALLAITAPMSVYGADSVTIDPLSGATAGNTVTVKGTSTLSEVTVKVVHPNKTIVYLGVTTVSGGAFSLDFTLPEDLTAGTYTVAAGNGAVADTATLNVAALPPIQLDQPVKPNLAGKIATWTAVTDENNGYSLQLYKDGSAFGSAVTIAHGAALSYSFSSAMTAAGSYTVTVIALGTGRYADSIASDPSDPQVVEAIAVTGVTLNKSSIIISKGSSETLVATVAPTDAANTNVIWSSNNAAVAAVSSTGKVTGITSGTAIITVTTADGGKTAACQVTVASSGGNTGGGSSGGSGGGVIINTISKTIVPNIGGSVNLNGTVFVTIPAEALPGSAGVKVTITREASSPAVPSGFSLLDSSYQFTAGSASSYHFSQLVTLTFTFDPSQIPTGSTPAVYYYNEISKTWVSLGGTVTGNTITVTVDHFTRFAVLAEKKSGAETSSQPTVQNEFSDITNHWAEEAIHVLAAKGIVSGVGNGQFAPDRSMTRAEFAAIIVKALDLKPDGTAAAFSDVEDTVWYSDVVKIACQSGIINGYSSGQFRPDGKVTREQAAVMIARAMAITKLQADLADGEAEQLIAGFSDGIQIGNWSRTSIAACIKAGIFSGKGNNNLDPTANMTRAEAAVMVRGLLQKSNLI